MDPHMQRLSNIIVPRNMLCSLPDYPYGGHLDRSVCYKYARNTNQERQQAQLKLVNLQDLLVA
jgi:hypothetical protein